MKKTVTQGFHTFHGTLTPTHWEAQTVKNHRKSLAACLEESFGVKRFFPTGSVGNGTGIQSYSDVDYFACIPTNNLKENSFTTLQDVQKVLLKKILRGSNIDIRPPAVRVRFGVEASESIEIIPANEIDRDKDGNPVYKIASENGDGSWQQSSPDAHKNYVDEVDRAFGGDGEVKRLVRFLKAWKYYCDVPIKSFYLELFVTRYASQKSSIIYSKDVRNILACLWNEQFAALKDPKGISGSIQPCLSKEQKTDALRKLNIAFERANEAYEAEKREDISGAYCWWNKVFARKFSS